MKKEIWILIILTIIIVLLIAVLSWPANKNNQQTTTKNNQLPQQKVEGIQINFPKANQEISSPLKISGSVNNGGWSGFEGQVGTVQLLDDKGNKITSGVLKAITDWTKSPVQFESTLNFQTKIKGSATLLFSNENPSGMPEKDKNFGLPIIIK
ncbi:MAG: Gmad2 immunoglobulin-like domain-containing protein [Candidatus Staskawiczbacteria bacterium]|jgi:Fe-S cluster assembly iron-binding protein IscA